MTRPHGRRGGLDSSGSGYGAVVGPFEQGNGLLIGPQNLLRMEQILTHYYK